MTLLVLFCTFLFLLLIEVPVSFALLISAAAAIAGTTGFSQGLVIQKIISASSSFPLIAVPLFILAGGIMSRGGMSRRLIGLASAVVGNIHGGLAITSVVACMLFSSISGSTAATTAAIGAVLIPAIVQSGFSRGSATSLLATAGSIGIIIPPSVPLILMGWISGISIGKLFLAGILPGLVIGGLLMTAAFLIAVFQKHPTSGVEFSLREVLVRFEQSILPLLAVVFILGGIMLGFVTATEAGVIAVVYALVISVFVYRELRMREIYEILVETAKVTGIVVLCIGAASPFAWLLTVEQLPARLSQALVGLTENPAIIKLIMIGVMLIIGTFLDLTPAMLILVPIFLPVAIHIGMDQVHFGLVVVAALGIGQCTPPVGIALFVACTVSGAKLNQLIKPLMPYLLTMLIALLLITFIPFLTLWLPGLLMGR